MVPAQVPQVLSALECPVCRGAQLSWTAPRLSCRHCGKDFQTLDGYLNLHPGDPGPVTPIQRLMQFPPAVAVYEGIWRPVGYFLASNHSFPRDLERITALIQRRRGLILDLACGPGNVTRQIARLAPESTVIGFDLSPQMLERAVRLTAKEGLTNVVYIRGSALAMPFQAEAFEAVTCCGALQLFTDQEQAVGEIARVLKLDGEFVCQTTFFPGQPPWIVRMADRLLKFGYFYLDDLRDRLFRFNLALNAEEQSNITYIFRAAKAPGAVKPKLEPARATRPWLRAAESAD
jgi:ubiquinone/menaquinone biosynthesis C-methylase UbiE